MGKDTGFIEFEKQAVPRREIQERVQDFREYDLNYSDNDIRQQASRCMDCGIPFCHMGCPLGNMIPDWNDLVYRDQWQDALGALHSTNNFPEFTGRICPAPCEDSCVLNEHYTLDPEEKIKKKHAVTIEQIEKHIAERGWEEGWIQPQPPNKETGKKIAVIGSGPAGLAAAQQLRRVGHQVTVFEKDDRLGGLLVYGIPDFKLDKIHVQRRIDQMTQEGVEFKTGIEIGKDLKISDLRKQFDALLIAIGAQHARKLEAEGNNLTGVHYAMDYLPQRSPEALKRQATTTRKGRTKPGNLREQVDPTVVQMWRTPDAHCDRGPSSKQRMKMKLEKKMPISLNDQVRHPRMAFPTPTARDHKDAGPNVNYEKARKKGRLAGSAGGSLNPTWVEWLMGYPKGWTDLKD